MLKVSCLHDSVLLFMLASSTEGRGAPPQTICLSLKDSSPLNVWPQTIEKLTKYLIDIKYQLSGLLEEIYLLNIVHDTVWKTFDLVFWSPHLEGFPPFNKEFTEYSKLQKKPQGPLCFTLQTNELIPTYSLLDNYFVIKQSCHCRWSTLILLVNLV